MQPGNGFFTCAILIALMLGIIGGLYPAYQATGLSLVEANNSQFALILS